MPEPEDRLQVIADFIGELDARVGAMKDEDLDREFTEFGEETQPELMGLFLAIAETHQVEIEFVNECAFLLLGLFRFYEERLDLHPPTIKQREVLKAIDLVDAAFDKLGPEIEPARLDSLKIPALEMEVPGLYSRLWEACLADLLEEGSIDEDLWLDLYKFYLVVATCLKPHLADVRVTPN